VPGFFERQCTLLCGRPVRLLSARYNVLSVLQITLVSSSCFFVVSAFVVILNTFARALCVFTKL